MPDNWLEQNNQGSSVWFAPEGAYGSVNGATVYTYGISLGVAQTNSRNLQQATDEFVSELQRGNSNLKSRTGFQRTTIDSRNAVSISMTNVNEATGRSEVINLVTTQLRSGQLLYLISLAPENDYASYQTAFQRILQSIRLND